MKSFSFQLHPIEMDALKSIARSRGCTVSTLIRAALKEFQGFQDRPGVVEGRVRLPTIQESRVMGMVRHSGRSKRAVLSTAISEWLARVADPVQPVGLSKALSVGIQIWPARSSKSAGLEKSENNPNPLLTALLEAAIKKG